MKWESRWGKETESEEVREEGERSEEVSKKEKGE